MVLKMDTTFTWKISNLERETSDGYVFSAHWAVSAENGDHTTGCYGSVGFERPEELIDYEDLTEDLVIDWVKDSLGEERVAEIESNLQSQLDELAAPTRASGLPF